MPPLDRTHALIAELAHALGLPDLPADASGGVRLTIGEATEVSLYGVDDLTLLLVAPIAALPKQPDYGLTLYLLRANMFDAETAPCHVGADRHGTLVFWGRVPIDQFDGPGLARLLERVAGQVVAMRGEIEAAA